MIFFAQFVTGFFLATALLKIVAMWRSDSLNDRGYAAVDALWSLILGMWGIVVWVQHAAN